MSSANSVIDETILANLLNLDNLILLLSPFESLLELGG
jgi:hypothetical protein